MVNESITQRIPWEPKKLSSEVGSPQLMESKLIEKLTRTLTACTREVEYMIERVFQVFLSFEPFEFGISWNLHQPKGVPSSRLVKPRGGHPL